MRCVAARLARFQLDVKGCKDIHESFAKYVEEELLDGDNKCVPTVHTMFVLE